jgi:argininosuccinate lyase
MQIIKESFLPVFSTVKACLSMAAYALEKIIPMENTLKDDRYRYIFSVDEVNRLVMGGTPSGMPTGRLLHKLRRVPIKVILT